jgi:DNA-binding NarL/FixJ family response regulator
MGNNELAKILIIDDEPMVCELLESMVSSLGIKAKSITQSLKVMDEVRNTFYNLVLLDVFMPERSGFDLIPDIRKAFPDTKIIIITGRADKEIVIKALRLGAFDFLEKPIDMDLLSYSVNRALHIQETELQYKKTRETLQRSQADLLRHREKLENLNTKLIQTNQALTVLAQNIARERQETEKRIVLKTRSLIIPIIERLQHDKNLRRYEAELSMLLRELEDLTSGLAADTKIATSLSFSELRIASLIKNGLTTEEIAKHLHISPSTIKTHRKNIRRKLGITNQQQNLRNYLESRLEKGSSA